MKGLAIQLHSRICGIATLALLSVSAAAGAPIQYLINVDTSSVSVNGTSGFLEFQFNPGGVSQPAFATISSFNPGGGTLDAPQVAGSVAGGPLPAPLTFTNDPPFNDVFQPFTYGSFFSFVLSLNGPALSSPDGTASTLCGSAKCCAGSNLVCRPATGLTSDRRRP